MKTRGVDLFTVMIPARLLLILLLVVSAGIPAVASQEESWVFCYRVGCGDCDRALPLVQAYIAAHPDRTIELCDLNANATATERYHELASRYGVQPGVPVLFADGQVVQGVEPIRTFLSGVPAPTSTPAKNASPQFVLTPLVVASAGLVDGINPCAFAVLALLLGTLAASGTRRRVLVLGGAYTVGVMLCYLGAGLGIIAMVGAAGIAPVFRLVSGAVSSALGLYFLLSAVLPGATIRPAIPERGRDAAGRWIGAMRSAGPVAAFGLGIGVGLIELPCTGGIYLGVLGLLADGALTEALPLLVLYNISFVLPLVLIVLAVAGGLATSSVDRWRETRRRLVLGITGFIMIALGAALLIRELL
jgi:cytochrome c biogenesis protein CcdA